MSDFKHTPEEWKAFHGSIITADDQFCIAVIEDDGGYEAPYEQREANAKLIAASPNLLEACKAALVYPQPPLVEKALRAAIAKAVQ